MTIKSSFAALLAVIFIIFSGGCADDTVFPGKETEKDPEFITSDVIFIPIEKVRTLNPVLSLDEDTYYLNKLVYQGLFNLNENLEAEGSLAESYNYLEDGKTLLINLRKDVLWQDGEAFTAEDVKFSIDAYQGIPETQQGSYGPIVRLIKSAKTLDDHTIQILFADPNNAALENLTFPILPSHKYSRAGSLANLTSDFIPLGTGPYYISNLETGKQITLSANPYYKGLEPENTLIFKYMPNKQEAINLFDIREIHMSVMRNINRNTLIEDKVVNMHPFPSNEVEVLGFNFNHGALQNPNVRQAIAYAVDNQMILENCYYNSGILNETIYYPGFMGVESEETSYKYDVNKAAELLKSSGYEGLSLNLLFNGENNARNLAAQVIKSGLEKAGASVTLIPLIKEEYNDALRKGDFDLYIGGFRINENYDLRPLLHSSADNPINYSNTQMDTLLDKLQQGISTSERRSTFEKLDQLYTTEMPYYCLLYKTYGLAVSTNLKGDIGPLFNNIYHGCESWEISYEKSEE